MVLSIFHTHLNVMLKTPSQKLTHTGIVGKEKNHVKAHMHTHDFSQLSVKNVVSALDFKW